MRTLAIVVMVVGMGAAALGAELENTCGTFQECFSPLTGCCPATVGEEPCIPRRTISVSGTAVARTVPDLVVWHVTTSDFDKNLLRAKESSDNKLKAILALREELGVNPEDMETGHLRIEREYHRDEHGNRTEFKHFAVTRSITIRQRDLKRFDEFLSKLVSSAEMEVSLGFESSRLHELRAETRLRALRIAREKAQAMAEELGDKLGMVLTVEEYRPSAAGRDWVSNVAYFDPESRLPADVSSGTFAPGAIEVRVTVYATFAIER